jgi:hypothetical protein
LRLRYSGISLILLTVAMSAQTVTFEDGGMITGIYLGGSPRQVKIEVGDQIFAASLGEPVVVDGQTVIPRGVDVVVKLVDAKESGKLTGRSILTLDLMSLSVNGRMVDVNTETVTEESSSRGARTAEVAGGTALLGTIIGAIAGGGKGAAIGLGSGAAAGAGAEILTKGQRVRIPSETRLTFVLENSVRLR